MHVAVFLFYAAIFGNSDGTGGVRQRNSSVPIRQVINRSRASLLLLRRNSTVVDGTCAVCDADICHEKLRENLSLFCIAERIDEIHEIEDCWSEEQLLAKLSNKTILDGFEGCSTTEFSEICWCQIPRSKSAKNSNSRMWRIQNAVQKKRLQEMLPENAATIASFSAVPLLTFFWIFPRLGIQERIIGL